MADTYDLTEVVAELRIANTKRAELNATAANVLATLGEMAANHLRIANAQERIAAAHERVADAQERIAVAQERMADCCTYGSLRSEAMLMVTLMHHDKSPAERWALYEDLVADLAPGHTPAPAPAPQGD